MEIVPEVVNEVVEGPKDYKKVACQICHKEYYRITNTHLYNHQTTMEEYRAKYPDAKIEDERLANDRVDHLRDKSYEEIYGEQAAAVLSAQKRESVLKTINDPEKGRKYRGTRDGALGRVLTDEQKKKISENNTIHGGSTYSTRALAAYGEECARCGNNDKTKLIVHHKNGINVQSVLSDHSLSNLEVLCKSCHVKWHNKFRKEHAKFVGLKDVEKGMHYVLLGLSRAFGLDLSDPNFDGTPQRVARSYAEIFSGLVETDHESEEILSATFISESEKNNYSGMVVSNGIEAFSMCPHHFLPVEMKIDLAYIPRDKVLGLSKLARLAILLAARPALQERLTDDIVNKLMGILGAKGAACRIVGRHMCVAMRGVRSTGETTITTSVRGVFADDQSTKAEFLSLAGSPWKPK